MSKKAGLPVTLKMRHDAHYVESLTSYSGAAVGRMIPVDQIRPNPEQPRKALGDLRELTASIREKGVLEPLLVRFMPREDCYHIISGERRYHASRAAGIREVPCIEKMADDAETLEIALIENMQRKDLTPFEEADGLAPPDEPVRIYPRGHGQEDRQGSVFRDGDIDAAKHYGGGAKEVRGERGAQQICAAADCASNLPSARCSRCWRRSCRAD